MLQPHHIRTARQPVAVKLSALDEEIVIRQDALLQLPAEIPHHIRHLTDGLEARRLVQQERGLIRDDQHLVNRIFAAREPHDATLPGRGDRPHDARRIARLPRLPRKVPDAHVKDVTAGKGRDAPHQSHETHCNMSLHVQHLLSADFTFSRRLRQIRPGHDRRQRHNRRDPSAVRSR